MEPEIKKEENVKKTKQQLQQITRTSNKNKEQAQKKKLVENIEGVKYVYSLMQKRNESKTGSNRRFFILNSCINFGYISKLQEHHLLPFQTIDKIPKRKQIIPLDNIINVTYEKKTLTVIFNEEGVGQKRWIINCNNEAMAIDWKTELTDACTQRKIKKQNKPIIIDIPSIQEPPKQSSKEKQLQPVQKSKPQINSSNGMQEQKNKKQYPKPTVQQRERQQKIISSRPLSTIFMGSVQSNQKIQANRVSGIVDSNQNNNSKQISPPIVSKFNGSILDQSSKLSSQKDKIKQQYLQKRKRESAEKSKLQGKQLKNIVQVLLDPGFELQKLRAEWWYEMAKGKDEYEVIERFKNYVEILVRRIIDELGEEERKRYYQPKGNFHYQIDNVELEVVVRELQETQDRTTVVSSARGKQLRQEMNNYNYILQLTRNRGKIRVPLMTIVEYKGFLVAAKAKTQLLSSNQSNQGFQREFQWLQNQSKIDHGLFQNPQNGTIYQANNRVLEKLARTDSINRKFELYYLQNLTHYIPHDFYQFNKERPYERLRVQLLAESQGKRYNGDNMLNVESRLKMSAEVKSSIKQLTQVSRNIGQKINEVLEALQNIDEYVTNSQEIAELLHSAGVNVRYIGTIYERCKKGWLKSILCTEIVARCAKYYCKFDLQQATLALNADSVVRANQFQINLVIKHLNQLFGNNNESNALWKAIIKHASNYFKCTLSKDHILQGYLIQAIQFHYGIILKDLPKQINIFKSNSTLSLKNFGQFVVKAKTYDPNFTDLYVSVNKHLDLSEESFEHLNELLNLQKREQVPSHFKLNKTYDKIVLFIGNWLPPQDRRVAQTQHPAPSKLYFQRRLTNIKWYLKRKEQSTAQSVKEQLIQSVQKWLGGTHPILTELYQIFVAHHRQYKDAEIKALTYAKNVIKNQQRLLGGKHIKLAEEYFALAQVHTGYNNKVQALHAFVKAREILIANESQETEAYGKICVRMGELYLALDAVENDAMQCASFACNTLFDTPQLHLSSLQLLCRCFEVRGKWGEYSEYVDSNLAGYLKMYAGDADTFDRATKLVILPLLQQIAAKNKAICTVLLSFLQQISTTKRSAERAYIFLKHSVEGELFPNRFLDGLKEIQTVVQEIETNGIINRWRGFENITEIRNNTMLFVAFLEALHIFLSGNFLDCILSDE